MSTLRSSVQAQSLPPTSPVLPRVRESSRDASSPKEAPKPSGWIAPLVALAAIIPYVNTSTLGFVGDDSRLILENPAIRSLAGVLSFFGFSGGLPEPRAVRMISYGIDFAIGGESPWIYHISNVLYHVVATLLVLALARRIIGETGALVAALVFAVHPVHSEAVASLAGRKDILVTIFSLLGVLSFVRFYERGGVWPFLGLTSCFAAGFFAKETAVVVPVLALAVPLGLEANRPKSRIRRLWAPLGLLAGSFVLAAITVFVFRISAFAGDGPWLWHGGSWARTLLTIPRLIARYVGLLVVPWGLQADYSFDAIPISVSAFEPDWIIAAAFVLLAATLVAWWSRRDQRAGFAAIWIAASLLPVLQLVPHHELFAERYLYLPSVGLALLGGLAFEKLRRRRIPLLAPVAVLLALAAVARTLVHNLVFQDFETVARSVAEVAPRCARAQYNLGLFLIQEGKEEEGLAHLRAAVEPGPGGFVGENWVFGPAWNQLGAASYKRLLKEGRGQYPQLEVEAETAFLLARDTWPESPIPSMNLHLLRMRLGDEKQAIEALAYAARSGIRDARIDASLAAARPSSVSVEDRHEVLAAIIRRLRSRPTRPDAQALLEHLRASGDPTTVLLVARLFELDLPSGVALEVREAIQASISETAPKASSEPAMMEALESRAGANALPWEALSRSWPGDGSSVREAIDRLRPWVHVWLAAREIRDPREEIVYEPLMSTARAVFAAP